MIESTDWIAYWRSYETTGEFPNSDVSYELDRMTKEQPEAAWKLILEILSLIGSSPEDSVFQALAAGPLEDLLANHGSSFIERVEAAARQDSSFRLLLGGVWRSTIESKVWERILTCHPERW